MKRAIVEMVIVFTALSTMIAATLEVPIDTRSSSDAKLVRGPRTIRVGENIKISFAVDKATDVEVAILNVKGDVVRHLAVGLLGKNAPAPFAKGTLAQVIEWNLLDDVGELATGKPFSVRVRVGVQEKLDTILGWNGNTIFSGIVGLAVGKDGELYVMESEVSRGRTILRVLDKDGQYSRTIAPYSSKVPESRLETVGRIEVGGKKIPIMYSGHAGNVYPLMAGMKTQTMTFSPKGHLITFSAVGSIIEHGQERYLMAFHPEGGVPDGLNLLGPQLRPGGTGGMGGAGEGYSRARDNVATSLDGEWIYLTQHIYSARFHGRKDKVDADGRRKWKAYHNGIYRVKWSDTKLGEPWLGEQQEGDDDEHFNDPQGIAVDKNGNLFIADRNNNRVMIFSDQGKLLGKFEVTAPEQIFVHNKTGEIYLLSRGIEEKRERPNRTPVLMKYSAWKKGVTPKKLAELDAPGLTVMTLDIDSAPVKIWAAYSNKLLPIYDKNNMFEKGEAVSNSDGLGFSLFMSADPVNKRLVVDDDFNGYKTVTLPFDGGPKKSFVKGTDSAIDKDGNTYMLDGYGSNSFSRYDKDGKPVPFSGTGSHKIMCGNYRGYGPNLGMRGIEIAPNGDIYIFRANNYGLEDGTAGQVDCFGPDGKFKRAFVRGLGQGDCGLGVDAAGNVYIGNNVKPASNPIPPDFAGQVPATGWKFWKGDKREFPWSLTYYNPYLYHLGSVMKFGPEGGAIWGNFPVGASKSKFTPAPEYWDASKAPADVTSYKSGYLYKDIKVKGAKWRYPGFSLIPPSNANWGDPSCICMTSDFGVDPYGRCFVPNVLSYSIDVLDTGGNLISKIGGYGNADNAGGADAIEFVCPAHVDIAAGKLYVSDWVNNRITVIKFEYSDKKTVVIK